jgi:hypothetical protein
VDPAEVRVVSHRHVDPCDPQETYGMPSKPCITCRRECCVDCADSRPTAEDPRSLKCWDCVDDERADADERNRIDHFRPLR